MADWQGARQKMERDISRSMQKRGMSERQANDIASKRANKAMERAVNVTIQHEGGRAPDIRSS